VGHRRSADVWPYLADDGGQRDTLGRGEGGRKSQRGAAGPETGGRGCVEGRATDMWRDCGRAAPGGVTVRCCGEMCRLGGVGLRIRFIVSVSCGRAAGAGMRVYRMLKVRLRKRMPCGVDCRLVGSRGPVRGPRPGPPSRGAGSSEHRRAAAGPRRGIVCLGSKRKNRVNSLALLRFICAGRRLGPDPSHTR